MRVTPRYGPLLNTITTTIEDVHFLKWTMKKTVIAITNIDKNWVHRPQKNNELRRILYYSCKYTMSTTWTRSHSPLAEFMRTLLSAQHTHIGDIHPPSLIHTPSLTKNTINHYIHQYSSHHHPPARPLSAATPPPSSSPASQPHPPTPSRRN